MKLSNVVIYKSKRGKKKIITFFSHFFFFISEVEIDTDVKSDHSTLPSGPLSNTNKSKS